MIAFTVFVLAGIVLFTNDHTGWGVLCFVIAVVDLLSIAA